MLVSEDREYEVLKLDIEYYFSKLMSCDVEKAKQTMRRVRALVDQKLSILERRDVAEKYGAVCPKCGSDEVEWLEKVHECEECQVWVISCLECGTEWVDVVWKV